jgi:Uma2 family endonuclease
MSTKAGVPVEEYLHTSYPDLDREYRDGEVVERTLPDYLHSRTQMLIGVFFENLRRRLPVYACPELRLKLRTDLYLIPDICVFWPSEPAEAETRPPDSTPLIAVDILSKDDRLSQVREKLEEYKAWGVPHVWLVDPHSRRMYTCDAGLTEVTSLPVPELDVTVSAGDIFS